MEVLEPNPTIIPHNRLVGEKLLNEIVRLTAETVTNWFREFDRSLFPKTFNNA